MLAHSRSDDEQAESNNMCKVLHLCLVHLPEIHHATASFRLRRQLMTPDRQVSTGSEEMTSSSHDDVPERK